MKLIILINVIIIINLWNAFPCSMVRISMDYKLINSDIVVEGEILNKISYWGKDSTMIYTDYKVNVLSYFKNIESIAQKNIVFTVEGGKVGYKEVVVLPGFNENIGEIGIFFLQSTDDRYYKLFTGTQGFIKYNLYNYSASSVFDNYSNIFNDIIKKYNFKSNLQELTTIDKQDNITQELMYDPQIIMGGTGQILTIKGKDFGKFDRFANVLFSNNDNGGGGYYGFSSSIVSWKNDEIKVKVPSFAGNGAIIIVLENGKTIESQNDIKIPYSINHNNTTLHLSTDGNGSRRFQLDSYFSLDTLAYKSFVRALENWRCSCFLNGSIIDGFKNYKYGVFDKINSVYFDQLSTGTLAVTYYTINYCSSNIGYIDESDIAFNNQYNWYFGEDNSCPSGFYDFESVALHELGHVFSIAHNNHKSSIMWYSIGSGATKRVLNSEYDVAAGVYSRELSINSNCVDDNMSSLNKNNCSLSKPPVADALISIRKGCLPLTVSFDDISKNSPTQSHWDIDNDGKIDYFSKNVIHTYTKPGTYSIKLITFNKSGMDSLILEDYIEVLDNPNVKIVTNKPLELKDSDTIELDAGSGYLYYRWNDGGDTTRIKKVVSPGYYQVFVIDSKGCSDYSDFVYVTSLYELITYPNPVESEFYIETTLKGKIIVDIYNYIGNKVNQKIIENVDDSIKISIDVINYPFGVYFYSIRNSINASFGKFVKG